MAPVDEDVNQKSAQDEKYNPATRQLNDAEQQGSFDDDFNSITSPDNMEQEGKPGDLAGGAKDAEENPKSGGYYNNYTGAQKKALKSVNKLHMLRKRGPLATIILLVFGGGLGFSALFTPGLLIVQMKEVMVNKFNTQLASMDVRTEKIISKKITGSTSGICAPVSIKCKYSTMSEEQVAKFKAAGIDVEGESISRGRIKPTKLTLKDGVSIKPNEFDSTYRTNSSFKSAVNDAYNPKFNGFNDSVWSRFADRIGISKKPKITGDTDEARAKSLDDAVRNIDEPTTTVRIPSTDEKNPATGQNYTQPEIDEFTKASNAAKKLASEAASSTAVVTEAVDAVKGGATKAASGASHLFSLSGVADNICQAYGAVQTLGYAAKTVRAVQLARYAMAFLNLADEIKAGNSPSPGEVAYMGGILTNIAYDAGSAATRVSRGSATQSYGYRFAAYGESGAMDSFTMQFLAGGGLTGELINVTSAIKTALSGIGGPQTCKSLANPWVQAGTLIGGIGLTLVPGFGEAYITGKAVALGAAQIAFSVAMYVLPNLLKNIVAGNVTKGMVGADAGDAYTSGADGLMGGVANGGGNSAMTTADALAYNDLQTKTVAYYNKLEASKLSPLDATSRYTFMGSIVSSLLPYYSRLGSFGGIATSIGSIVSSSFASIIPKSSALSDQQYADSLKVCQDYDYQQLGIAVDPFCNVIYGIAPKYLNKDPVTVINELESAGEIDPVTGDPIGAYKTFADQCIGREKPLGGAPVSSNEKNGSECVLNDQNANYYLHYIDQRVMGIMDDTSSTASTTASAANTTLPTGTMTELAQLIKSSGNVNDTTGQIDQVIAGTRSNIYTGVLQVLASLSTNNKFTISSMKRDGVLLGNTVSQHLIGHAVDISGSSGINGVVFGYNGVDPTIQSFLNQAAATLPENCDIGVPNQTYVNSTQPLVKSGCKVFIDIGTGAHIHLDIRGVTSSVKPV